MPTTYNIEPEIAVKADRLTKIYRYRGLISSIFSRKNTHEVSALKEFSLEVKKGEILGIIGSNGSGKSTLMKVLSGVTLPTSGTAEINGKLFAAIEVSGGFNPDFTGYKNLILTAKIWGFSNDFIKNLIPVIIEFSDLKDFIHVPVKKYSSGMVSRLASSLIVHSDADIFLLDEVLNGSDLSFKHKMHKKVIEENQKGKTIIISSHTISDILSLCNRAVIINKGENLFDGNPFQAHDIYSKKIKNIFNEPENKFAGHHDNTFIEVQRFSVSKENKQVVLTMTLKRKVNLTGKVLLSLIINNEYSTPTAHTIHEITDGFETIDLTCTIPESTIGSGNHFITLAAFSPPGNWMYLPRICNFIITHENIESDFSFIPGVLIENAKWE